MGVLGKGGGSGAGSLGAQLKGLNTGAREAAGGFSFLRGVAATALGGLGAILAADIFKNALAGIKNFVEQGVSAVGEYQSIIFSLTSLQARELVDLGQFDSLGAAMDTAKVKAGELYGWMERLAIASPFSVQDVAAAFRQGQAYGFASEQAQLLVQTLTDYTAATGQSGEVIRRAMLAFGQIQAQGRLMGQVEVRDPKAAGTIVKNWTIGGINRRAY